MASVKDFPNGTRVRVNGSLATDDVYPVPDADATLVGMVGTVVGVSHDGDMLRVNMDKDEWANLLFLPNELDNLGRGR